ncbi:type IV pilus twitching motility protein PilT [Elusimicrobiota bacterium]
MIFEELLMLMKRRGASDLHISAGSPPILRVDGKLIAADEKILSGDECQKLIYSVLNESQRHKFEEMSELDSSFSLKEVGRFRLNVFRQKGFVGAAVRLIPQETESFEQLGLPQVIYEVSKLPKGLILVTGPTGSGKSTTLASIINHINENRALHILTIEDPIEFVHPHKKSIVNQREIGDDCRNFSNALRHVLRQDPDVILVGEMRDLETVATALTVAETGHLVFATLHTNDAIGTINRIIDVFPSNQQEQIRVQLSFVLEAVFSQQLLQHSSGHGRAMACEVLIATTAIRNLIREVKIEQIHSLIQAGAKYGMQTMNQSLCSLYNRKMISYQAAIESTLFPDELKKLLAQKTEVKIHG